MHQNADLIRRIQILLGRRPTAASDKVEPIVLCYFEALFENIFIDRRSYGIGEYAIVDVSPEKLGLAGEEKLVPFGGKIPNAEFGGIVIEFHILFV